MLSGRWVFSLFCCLARVPHYVTHLKLRRAHFLHGASKPPNLQFRRSRMALLGIEDLPAGTLLPSHPLRTSIYRLPY